MSRRIVRSVRGLLALALLSAALAPSALAREPLRVHETEYLKIIYYTQDHEYLVPHVVRCFENSLAFHRELFDYTPSEKIVVLLHDFGDYGHGGTSTVPWNYITIGISPFDYVYETMPANERINWLGHHELVHVVATDQGAGLDNGARAFFRGKVAPTDENPLTILYSYLASPRWYAPRWYHEGIAVFLETWMAGGMGRVLGGYDEMVFRTMVREDRHFYDIVGLESEGTTIDFQVGQNSYLYGTRFVTYLGLTHGPEKLLDWFSRVDGSKRYFSSQFQKVYGRPLREEWRAWIEWEHAWQAANLERIREYPVTADRAITERTLGSVSRPYLDPSGEHLYAAVNYPGRSAHIAAISLEDGHMEKIADITGPALYYVSSLAYDPDAGTLFFTTDNSNGWRDLNAVDLATRKTRRLMKDFRGGDLVINPADRSLWAVQHHRGRSTIITMPAPYEGWHTLIELPYGRDVFDIDISPDGTTLSAGLIEIDGRQRLVSMNVDDLLVGDGSYEVLFDFEHTSPAGFVFSDDGRYLYGSSYYSGVSNLFRYDLETGDLDALTNTETGYFRPLPVSDDTLVAMRFGAEGFVPVTLPHEVVEDVNAVRYLGQEVVIERPVVEDWNAGPPSQVDLDAVTLNTGVYRAGRGIRFASWYPVIEGYKDALAYGARLNFNDAVGLHSLSVTATYTPTDDFQAAPRDERIARTSGDLDRDGTLTAREISRLDRVGRAIQRELDDVDGNEQLHLDVTYNHWPWKVRASHNGTDFYDLFGPTKTSRKGTTAGVTYENFIINEPPRVLSYALNVSGHAGLERLPLYQNVAADVEDFQTFAGVLGYRRLRGTIGGVDRERGLAWSLGANAARVARDDLGIARSGAEIFARVHSDLDYGFQLPLDHSSIWLRSSVGYSLDEETSSFANFYFGGFGNNWVDHGSIRRYRGYDSFPGLEINDVEANRYGKLLVEWTLPPLRFRHLGAPGFYSNWAQAMLFGSTLRTDPHLDDRERTLYNVGVQVDVKLVMFSNLESTLSLGYALAFENGEDRASEFMASLRILR